MELTKQFLQTKVTYIDGEVVTTQEANRQNPLATPVTTELTMREAIRKGLTFPREGDKATPEQRVDFAMLAHKIWNSDSYTPSSEEITMIKGRCKEYWLPEVALFIIMAIDPASVDNGKVKNMTPDTTNRSNRTKTK